MTSTGGHDGLGALVGADVLVTGAGVSGPGAVRILDRLGARITVADARPEALERLRGAVPPEVADGLTLVDLDEAGRLLTGPTPPVLVVTSPGWRPDSPLLSAAAAVGVPVWGDVELAWSADDSGLFGPRRRWLAVTGTNGKTTTTSMLEAICREGGLAARACGNIGLAVTDILLAEPRVDVLACELSSFQLHWAPSCRPDAGVVLNVAEDHLDWHGSMAAYVDAKARVLTGDVAVAGVDDDTAACLLDASTASRRIGFRLDEPAEGELGVVDGVLVDRAFANGPRPLVRADEVRPSGPAGVLDALAAAALGLAVGVDHEAVGRALRGFEVGTHRAQSVDMIDGVRYVDDSKATNPHAARTSLLAGGPVVWIAGGLLKGTDIDPLVVEVAGSLRGVVLIGRDRGHLAAALRRHAPTVPVVELPSGDDGVAAEPGEPQRTMDRAVAEAAALAVPGDRVLLAPAAASMDMFTDYAHRGRSFAEAVGRRRGPVEEVDG